jgi:hypothetical protein
LKEPTALRDLGQFLFDHVASYEELEALLLLQQGPDVAWSIEETAGVLGLSTDACRSTLESLAAHGLLVVGGATFRYAPANGDLAAASVQLQRAYTSDRFAIVQLMTTNALQRVRAAALGRFGALQQRDDPKSPSSAAAAQDPAVLAEADVDD